MRDVLRQFPSAMFLILAIFSPTGASAQPAMRMEDRRAYSSAVELAREVNELLALEGGLERWPTPTPLPSWVGESEPREIVIDHRREWERRRRLLLPTAMICFVGCLLSFGGMVWMTRTPEAEAGNIRSVRYLSWVGLGLFLLFAIMFLLHSSIVIPMDPIP